MENEDFDDETEDIELSDNEDIEEDSDIVDESDDTDGDSSNDVKIKSSKKSKVEAKDDEEEGSLMLNGEDYFSEDENWKGDKRSCCQVKLLKK